MEPTRHLSISAEEKADQRREAFEKRLKGLLQQYADDALNVYALQDRITTLQTEMKLTDREIVVEAVFDRIDPDRDNQRWLDFLSKLTPSTGEPLQETLTAHREQKADLEHESAPLT